MSFLPPQHQYCNDLELELPHVIQKRNKQIDLGKNTQAYTLYVRTVPYFSRNPNIHPMNPNANLKTSKRRWDLMVRDWRRKFNYWRVSTKQNTRVSQPRFYHTPTYQSHTSDDFLQQQSSLDLSYISTDSETEESNELNDCLFTGIEASIDKLLES